MPYTLNDFKTGDHVELHPATDAWMRGDRYGQVKRVGRKHVHVFMDRSERLRAVAPHNIGDIIRTVAP